MNTHRSIRFDQVARTRQEIGEIESARARLEGLVLVGGAGQLDLQGRRQIGIRVTLELLEIGEEAIARGEHFCTRHLARRLHAVFGSAGLAELVAAALARPGDPAVAYEIDEAGLPPIEVL